MRHITMILFIIICFLGTALAFAQDAATAATEPAQDWVTKYGIWAGLALLIGEYIIGKTTLIKANSSIDAILNAVMAVVRAVFGLKKT